MANKPIIQQAQLTDENGVAAVTVATGGAVTVGPSASTATHTLHGALRVITGFTALANGATYAFRTGGKPTVTIIRIDASGNLRIGQVITSAGAGTAAVLSQAVGIGSITLSGTFNNAGTLNVYASAGSTYSFQNNTGISVTVAWSSSEIE